MTLASWRNNCQELPHWQAEQLGLRASQDFVEMQSKRQRMLVSSSLLVIRTRIRAGKQQSTPMKISERFC